MPRFNIYQSRRGTSVRFVHNSLENLIYSSLISTCRGIFYVRDRHENQSPYPSEVLDAQSVCSRQIGRQTHHAEPGSQVRTWKTSMCDTLDAECQGENLTPRPLRLPIPYPPIFPTPPPPAPPTLKTNHVIFPQCLTKPQTILFVLQLDFNPLQ